MAGSLARLAPRHSSRNGPLWIDATAYCRNALLAGEPLPWGAPGELANFFGKAHAMLGSDAVLIDIGDAYAHQVRTVERLRAAMSEQGSPLRTLLAHASARSKVVEGVRAIAAAVDDPVVVSVPSPPRWCRMAAAEAGIDGATPDSPPIEQAADCVAEAIGAFAGIGLGAVVIDEGGAGAGELGDPECYRPMVDVAEANGWPVLLRTDQAPVWSRSPVPGLTAWLGRPPADARVAPWGEVAGPDHHLPLRSEGGSPRIVTVPAFAEQDDVMFQVKTAR